VRQTKPRLLVMSLYFLLFLSFFTSCITAIDVTVGPDNAFHPNVVYGNPGQFVNFHFAGSGFSASEATARLSDPCNTEGGFDSGVVGAGADFSIVISTHNSIYVFSQNQCTQGFVMIVNPGPGDSVAQYQRVASHGAINNQQSSPSPSSTSTRATTTRQRTSTYFTSSEQASTQSKATPSSTTFTPAAAATTTSTSAQPTSPASSSMSSTSIAPVATPASASTDSALPIVNKGIISAIMVLFAAVLVLL
jgi:hypothetical protein